MSDFLKRILTRPKRQHRDVETLLSGLKEPAVHVRASDRPTRSHFGGSPRLPENVAWPVGTQGKLGFVARLSLPEIQATLAIDWLPEDGALLFFYDLEDQPWGFDPRDRGKAQVIHVPDLVDAVSAADEADKPEGVPFRSLRFTRIETLPSWERVRPLELSRAEEDAFETALEAVHGGKPHHQVSGLPSPIQGDHMELECQLVTHGIYCGGPEGYAGPESGIALGRGDFVEVALPGR